MTSEICGTTPEAWTFRQKISAYPASETTPSWIRAPPESLIPITGQPNRTAMSITLHTFSANTSDSEPPKTVKSCENANTFRPRIVPYPVTTASPHGRFSPHAELGFAMPHEPVELDERPRVEQLLEPLAGEELPALALPLDGAWAACMERLVAELREPAELGLGGVVRRHCR